MAWDAGTITNAAPWATLSGKLKALVGGAGVENWSFVENIPAGTGAGQTGNAGYSADVFVCRGTNTQDAPPSPANKLNASDTNAGNATSIVFAGVAALAASKVYTIAVINTKASAADDPTAVTLDGANAPTFTKIKSQASGDASTAVKVTLWMGKSGGAAPTGTNLTVNFGAGVETSVLVIMDEWSGLDDSLAVTGVDGTGAAQVAVQVVGANGTTATAHAVTMAALLGPKSIVYQVAGQTASAGTYTPGSGWAASTAAAITVATPTASARAQFKQDNEETVATLTLSSATNETAYATIGIELQRKRTTTALTTLNDAGQDWFFILEIPAADGAVNSSMNCAERYSAGAGYKFFSSMPPTIGANNPVGTGYWRTRGFFDYHDVTGNNRANLTHQALNTSGFNYWIKLTKNGVLIATKVGAAQATNGAILLDSFVTNATDGCPLISVKVTASTGSVCTFSRLPGIASVVGSTAWAIMSQGWTGAMASGFTNNNASGGDAWATGKVHVSRVLVMHFIGFALPPAANSYGLARGLMKTDILAVTLGGTVNIGDTMVIGGNTWTVIGLGYIGNTSSQNLAFLVRAN